MKMMHQNIETDIWLLNLMCYIYLSISRCFMYNDLFKGLLRKKFESVFRNDDRPISLAFINYPKGRKYLAFECDFQVWLYCLVEDINIPNGIYLLALKKIPFIHIHRLKFGDMLKLFDFGLEEKEVFEDVNSFHLLQSEWLYSTKSSKKNKKLTFTSTHAIGYELQNREIVDRELTDDTVKLDLSNIKQAAKTNTCEQESKIYTASTLNDIFAKSSKENFNPAHLFQFKRLKVRLDSLVYYFESGSHPASVRGIPWSMFEKTFFRLVSFAEYPLSATKSASLLANQGFVYIGDGQDDSVVCFFCGKGKKNWEMDEVIEDAHKAMSPLCPKVLETVNTNDSTLSVGTSNFLMEREENTSNVDDSNASRSNDNEALTSEPVGRELDASPSTLISQVTRPVCFSSDRRPDIAKQDTTNVLNTPNSVRSSTTSQGPNPPIGEVDQTRNHNSNEESRNGNPNIPTYFELGIITELPKRPEFALIGRRMESFATWPRHHHLTPGELAEAGFFFVGYGDCTRCFFCGGGLRNWEDDDDVWVEHARWFSRCAFLLQKQGRHFVDIVQDLHLQSNRITLADVQRRLGIKAAALESESVEAMLKRDPAVISVLQLGYLEDGVIEVAQIIKQEESLISSDLLIQRLEQEEKKRGQTQRHILPYVPDDVEINLDMFRDLKERNSQIRQQILCKICLDKDVSVVYLPCGHLVSCGDCASAMRNCPICRTNVRGISRAVLS